MENYFDLNFNGNEVLEKIEETLETLRKKGLQILEIDIDKYGRTIP